jgi:isopenicillin-N N-acyltransferase like protein
MTFPLIRLEGDAFHQGVQHGTELKERVLHNLKLYFYRFQHEIKLTRTQTLEMASKVAGHIEAFNPEYAAGMRGIAQAVGRDYLEIAALNARYEILYFGYGEQGLKNAGLEGRFDQKKVDGCTLFAALPEAMATGNLTMGQNWDWIVGVQGALLHTTHDDGLESLAFTEAGIFGGKIGFNSFGLGVCISGLVSMDDDWSRPVKPTHLRCYEILRSRDFVEAQRIVSEGERACSTNFMIAAAPDQVADFETAPHGVRMLTCAAGSMAHTNHFLEPELLGITEPPSERRPHSYFRQELMTRLMESKRPLEISDIQEFLSNKEDYPDGICRSPNLEEPEEDRVETIAGIIMDLQAKTMWVTDGHPDVKPFELYSLTAGKLEATA